MSVLNSGIRENLSTTLVNLPIEDDHSPLLAYVVWIFVAYLTYPVIPPYLHPFGNEDTIFDPGITINHFYFFEPVLSHRHGAFKKFNTHHSHLNEWPMIINGKNTPILDVLLAPDSPNKFYCFHCKDMLRNGEACKRCTCAKCGSGLGKGNCFICGHNQNSLNDSLSISETSSQSPSNIDHCCYKCGDPLDDIFCQQCTCMFCGKEKQEEKRIEEEQVTKARYWKIPACCDDDDDYDSAITPILSTEEPKLLYDNSSPRPPEEFNSKNSNAEIKSFSPSPIPNKDSDSFMEEIDLFLTPDDPMPPSIEDDEDSKGDILFERLLHDDPIPLPDTLDFSYEVRIFLPFFTYPVTSPVLLSSGSEDKIFDPGIIVNRSYSFSPDLSHRCGTFKKFNTHRSHLNESPMEMLFSTFSPMDQ
nr:hypothetical protein [Tanacetum cinerariifolium]